MDEHIAIASQSSPEVVKSKGSHGFEAHGQRALEKYRDVFHVYQRFAQKIKEVLEAAISPGCAVHSIDARAKDPDSFKKKASKCDKGDLTRPRYPNPLSDITDMAGVRVITFVPDALQEVEACIRREFSVTWNEDVGETRYEEGRFGYKSIHFLVKLLDNRDYPPEYSGFKGLVAEIQIRTIMQHAWAEMEHDIRYKGPDKIPANLEKRFTALAGMMEIADREFQAVQDLDAEFRSEIEAKAQDELVQTQLDIGGDEVSKPEEPQVTPAGTSEVVEVPGGEKKATPSLARYYITNRRYRDAAEVYSRMIEDHPEITTLYSGRAKARFLAGDRNGAFDDIAYVLGKLPNDPGATYLKAQLETGSVERRQTDPNETQSLSVRGRSSLREGRGEEAFEHYTRAQEEGANFFYSQLNKAMACIVIKDPGGANYFLELLRLYPDPTPIRVTVLALKAVVACLLKTGSTSAWNTLQDELSKCPEYRYTHSVLPDLEAGLRKRDGALSDCVERIFDHLRSVSEERSATPDVV